MRIVRKRKSTSALPISVRGCKVAVFNETSGGIAACRTGATSVQFIAENSIDKTELEEIARCFKNASVSSSLTSPVDVCLLGRAVPNSVFALVKQSGHIVVTSASVSLDPFLAEGFHVDQQEPGKPTVLARPCLEGRLAKRRRALVPDSAEYSDAVLTSFSHMDLGPDIEEVD